MYGRKSAFQTVGIYEANHLSPSIINVNITLDHHLHKKIYYTTKQVENGYVKCYCANDNSDTGHNLILLAVFYSVVPDMHLRFLCNLTQTWGVCFLKAIEIKTRLLF